jgi:hypothetical protein
MARMSTANRIELGNAMVARWTEQNHKQDRSVRFVSDMIFRMSRGKGLTKKQREWFDSAVLSNPPEPQNKEMVAKLKEGAATPGVEKERADVMLDFAYKLGRGWSLSEKQTAWMNGLLTDAAAIKENGPWVPSDELRALVEVGVVMGRAYSPDYLYTCQGIDKALKKCQAAVDGTAPWNKWATEKVGGMFKGQRAKLADARLRWPAGDLVMTKKDIPALVVKSCYVAKNGALAIDILCGAAPLPVHPDHLVKPRLKKKKKV